MCAPPDVRPHLLDAWCVGEACTHPTYRSPVVLTCALQLTLGLPLDAQVDVDLGEEGSVAWEGAALQCAQVCLAHAVSQRVSVWVWVGVCGCE